MIRGATQREVKLEITGSQNDALIKSLDDILRGLRYQDGQYDLVKIHDKEYQDKLQTQSAYWEKLKTEIELVRRDGYQNTDIVQMIGGGSVNHEFCPTLTQCHSRKAFYWKVWRR